MKPGMKMMMANTRRQGGGSYDGQPSARENGGSRMQGGYETPRGGGYERPRGGGYDMAGGESPEMRFRDRRGREHYDNGRYAPQNRGGQYTGDWDIRVEGPYRMGDDAGGPMARYGRGEEADSPRMHLMQGKEGGEEKGKMGFSSNGIDGKQRAPKPFDAETAKEWTSRMENADGSTGPRWTQEQAKSLMTQIGLQGVHPAEFWAVLNAQYSDLCKVAKKYGVDRPEFYAELAKAWLEDKDAVPDKAAAYYEYVVK